MMMRILLASLVTMGSLVFTSSSLALVTSTPPEKTWFLEDEKNTIDVFKKAADSVVYVETKADVRDMFSPEVHEVPIGAGTGFLWDNLGHVVTNYHVIENSRSKTVTVRLRDGRSLQAKVVGAEPRKDVALLQLLESKNLPSGFSTQLADSSELQVGQKTIAIGNPFELSNTLTTGVVSAVNRSVPSPVGNLTNRDMIQTDAAINPGNSGGPLMDSRGYLIGMNSVIYSQSGTNAGVGFAVPSNSIKRIIVQLIKNGKITQPGLGIVPLDERFNQMLNVKGVIILDTAPHSGARKAGLHKSRLKANGQPEFGDIIVAIEGKKVEQLDDIYSILENRNVGDTVKVDYIRGGKKQSTSLQLSNIQE
jgi:S1-C subfamily serine protease